MNEKEVNESFDREYDKYKNSPEYKEGFIKIKMPEYYIAKHSDEDLQAAVLAEREACAKLCEEQEECGEFDSRPAPLSQPEQEPVAWISDSPTKGNGKQLHFAKADAWKWSSNITPLYAAPPRKEWVGLTDEEVDFIADSEWEEAFVRLVEAKLKERNT